MKIKTLLTTLILSLAAITNSYASTSGPICTLALKNADDLNLLQAIFGGIADETYNGILFENAYVDWPSAFIDYSIQPVKFKALIGKGAIGECSVQRFDRYSTLTDENLTNSRSINLIAVSVVDIELRSSMDPAASGMTYYLSCPAPERHTRAINAKLPRLQNTYVSDLPSNIRKMIKVPCSNLKLKNS